MKIIVLIAPFLIFTACAANVSQTAKKAYADGSVIGVEIAGKKFNLAAAATAHAKAKGLSGRDKMPSDGMIFLFGEPQPLSFWMKDMRFPIDIIWINGGKIVSITENAVPEPGVKDEDLKRYFPGSSADTVIELNAGDCGKYKIKAGDTFAIK
ncbi:MAG: DUF192 domain-containing protein [Endomicrobium sp.]|jgi:uncharacterized membrane protein (UPF0127 family)|nr:DUF192 domain-containing protein [Endomicrobium sp.]